MKLLKIRNAPKHEMKNGVMVMRPSKEINQEFRQGCDLETVKSEKDYAYKFQDLPPAKPFGEFVPTPIYSLYSNPIPKCCV